MKIRWSDEEAAACVARYGGAQGEALALRTYTARLLGAEPALVLHGGGNTSVKARATDLLGHEVDALYIKASGFDLATLEPGGHPACDLARLRQLRTLASAEDDRLAALLRSALLDPRSPTPSIEAPVHALLPARFVDHTHADAILALTNRPDGEAVAHAALGGEVIVLPYVEPGLALAQATIAAFEAQPAATGMVWAQHGLVTWGETAHESYERMIELVSRAEEHLARERGAGTTVVGPRIDPEAARRALLAAMPRVRGALALPLPEGGWARVILRPLADVEVLAMLSAPDARAAFERAPLTADHLIRTGRRPLWLDESANDHPERFGAALTEAVERYAAEERELAGGEAALDLTPRVVLVPGAGAIAAGWTARDAQIAADITAQTLAVKSAIAAAGARYQGLSGEHLTAMRYRGMQQAKLGTASTALTGTVAVVTGAAGAIGAGICRVLAEAGACVAVTDLAGPAFDSLGAELAQAFPHQILAQALDVTDPVSVAAAFDAVTLAWGGVDLVVANAGAAHVATLEDLDLDTFRRLERINSEGTLLLLAESARRFRLQGTGGDVVLISTKNVFAPGASFGAYSATKAAAHQLARIASLELAEIDVRVNMVAPDAVFSDGARRSGLWQEVGPSRMKARGLDEAGLEEYYRGRNLLKARITARHVGEAVLFFASRKTPTTGATLPVDGGLPDATPR